MQKLMKERLRELKRRQKRRRQIGMIAAFFGVIVIGGVVWGMARPGVAMTGDATCGLEEHKHSDKCYENVLVCGEKESEGHKHDDSCYKTEEVLVCDKEESEGNPEEGIEGHTHGKECYEEKKELICKKEESEGHTHSDECYKEELVCGKEEHTHEEECYIDQSADVEKKSDWDKQYKSVKWKDAWGEDLVTAADKQVGYKESSKNYKKVNGDQKGYTRFGEFSGEPYADWDAAFVNFCIHYAGISKSDVFPNTTSTNKWYNKFSKVNGSFLAAPDGYEPEKGDIVFFEKKKGETDFTMGIVSSSDKDKKEIKVIEGNIDNAVKEEKYGTGDSQIFAYIKVTELEQAFKGMESDDTEDKEEEPTEETEESEEQEEEETEDLGPAFDDKYEGDGVVIHVKADEGVIPEGAELSVTPIEKKKITGSMSAEEKEEAEKVNAQYDMTSEKLNEESEKKERKLEGFLAYDICFMLDGKEIEPNGEVKVTMDFKEAVAPEGVSEDAQVAVNHLKENGNGGVKVENLTEASTTTIQTAEKDAAVEKVELVADNFSIFTISWQYNGMSWGVIEVEYVDEAGNLLTPNESVSPIMPDLEFNKIYDLKDLIGDRWTSIVVTEGKDEVIYEPVRFWIGDKKEVEKVQCNMSNWEFMDSSNKVVFSCQMMEISQTPLQIVFQRAAVAELEIENNIKTTGNLDVKLTGSALKLYEDADEKNKDNDKSNDVKIKFVWYKKVNNNDFEEVRIIDYDDDTCNITGDYGESLNVALDGGSLSDDRSSVQYKVELYIADALAGTSKSESIVYYNELQNGSFEDPIVEDSKNWADFPHEDVRGWWTTARNPKNNNSPDIEIVRVFENGGFHHIHASYEDVNDDFVAADGDQFAELNAESQGSLYQDVLTIKGVRLNYHLAHRARSKGYNANAKDPMYLVIIPTWLAEAGVDGSGDEIDTQAEVKELINKKDEYGSLIYVKEFTAVTSQWTEHDGTYMPQYNLNRFFFVSAQEMSTEGNYLDDVWFSQDLPKPKEHSFTFRITKTITGLDEISGTEEEKIAKLKKKIASLKFNITVPNVLKPALKEYIPEFIEATNEKMVWTEEAEGVYTGIYNFTNVPFPDGASEVEITVKEEGADIDPYGLTTTVISMHNGDTQETQSGQQGTVTLTNNSTGRLIFENVYGTKDNSIWKVVKRSSSDKTQLLKGATFVLTKEYNALERIATGETDKEGVIQWKDSYGNPYDLSQLNGNYILRETKAPEGYSCAEKGWILTFNNGKLDAIALQDQIKDDGDFIVLDSKDDVHEISIYNNRLYELPSTGGKGIYLYMFSGILLMAGGLLMTYKNKRREVLGS